MQKVILSVHADSKGSGEIVHLCTFPVALLVVYMAICGQYHNISQLIYAGLALLQQSMHQNEIFKRKISFIKRYLPHNNLSYMPLPLFQKWTRLGAQHSMAKQPIPDYVSNHNRTCGKSVSENSE